MRMIAAAGAALTLMITVPAGAASLVTSPSAIAPDSGIITIQSPQAVQRGNVVYPRQGPVVRGPVVRGPAGGAAVRGPRGNVVVAPGRRGPVGGPVRRGNVAGGVAAGVAAGLIGGALLGGLAQPEPEPVYVAPRRRVVVEDDEPVYVAPRRRVVVQEEPAYYERPRCMSFRSYDPRTGTFIDRNGIERVCR